MSTREGLLAHPFQAMVLGVPLALLGMSAVFDVVGFGTANGRWIDAAHSLVGIGGLSALFAAVLCAIDWSENPQGTQARSAGTMHGGFMLAAVALFAASWWLRRGHMFEPGVLPVVFSLAGCGSALAGSWFGVELLSRQGVGAHDRAHV